MDSLLQLIFRLFLVVAGIFLFFFMLIVGAISAFLLMLRILWDRLTGKAPQTNLKFRFWTVNKKAPRPSQRVLDDVTDVRVKEVIPPEEMDFSDRSDH